MTLMDQLDEAIRAMKSANRHKALRIKTFTYKRLYKTEVGQEYINNFIDDEGHINHALESYCLELHSDNGKIWTVGVGVDVLDIELDVELDINKLYEFIEKEKNKHRSSGRRRR